MALHSSLSGLGIVWSLLTCLSVFSSCFGVYMQNWLSGTIEENGRKTQFNLFRRCNYYTHNPEQLSEFYQGCGRYASFQDIPAVTWQTAIILAAVSLCMNIFTAFLSLFACCLEYYSKGMSKFSGCLQMFSGALLGGSCALFAYGMDNEPVHSICKSSPFNTGTCTLDWAFWLTVGTSGLILILSVMAFFSSHDWSSSASTKPEPQDYYL